MEGRVNVVVFMALFVTAMLHGSSAQTTHVVGDSLGWLVPPGGDLAYRTWAATQTFFVGDFLFFNFTTGTHDVGEVSKAAYDSCNATNPISMSTTGPTTITLTSGEHHFICTFTRHCEFGQKLAINVSAPPPSATPPPPPATPSPATPPPVATPAPPPSTGAMTYIVGDNLGWLVPPGGPIAYQTWAKGKTFVVGDILVFNFTNGAHDVVQVTKAEFESCNITTTTTSPLTTTPARITLTTAGEHYYICTFSQHCSFGQKLSINVTAGGSTSTPPSASAPAPSSTATPPSASAPAPSSTATPPSASAPAPSSTATPPSASPPAPSSTATPPSATPPAPSSTATPPSSSGGSTPLTPAPVTTPPTPSSAPSFAAAALPFTFLAVAMAFFV